MASIPQTPRTAIPLTSSTADDTPLKRDLSSSGVFIYGDLDEQKAAVIQALGNQIPEVDLEFMLSNILPISSVDQQGTLDALKAQGHWSENSGWQEFGGVPPKKTVGREPLVFARMRAINTQILANAKFSTGFIPLRTLELRDSPDSAPESDTDVATRPDACGLLETFIPIHTNSWQKPDSPSSSRLLHWFDIAYSLEYKKDDSIEKSNDNTAKILWSMHHLMNVDNRRRFTFGITIENVTVRVWFCSRQVVLVSKPFDFMKTPEYLIWIFVSLHYASVALLGYDSTIKHVWSKSEGTMQCEIDVFGISSPGKQPVIKQYRTTGSILSNEAFIIRSRATRVYAAYEISDASKTQVVIKDSWVDATRHLEGDILQDILQDVSAEEKALFLTVLIHGIVQSGGVNDSTEEVMIRGDRKVIIGSVRNRQTGNHIYSANLFNLIKRFNVQESRRPLGKHRVKLAATNVSTSYLPQAARGPYVDHAAKIHYRIVFQEKGTSLHHHSFNREIEMRSILIPVLYDTIKALGVMWRKGYVHRDISDGNILLYGGRARLVDLEFAKKYGTGPSSPVRTGNYNFIATGITLSAEGSILHNPLHDLESVWWLGVWALYCHHTLTNLHMPVVQEHANNMGTWSQTLFPVLGDHDTQATRSSAFQRRGLTVEHFPAAASQGPCRNLFVLLDQLRNVILTGYSKTNTTPVDPNDFFVHDALASIFANPMAIPDCKLFPIDYVLQEIQRLNASQEI
ncbi:hypothetical protein HYPSUDRAFT_86460 [Hypholoma sublateritium FD-334 SS-4]|uniref:Fungal-type protein kinase domain-containing protein n=1 Tax=Hypholoma sublateritium (strain FD-334 SS-4) TaxID=945553 RepID=A0A0D2P5F7_HYPSF|nr:hypothetical protein HYPSUDRAFT_86460 [Hypholoma sublateritium FD-334 SS-4]